MNRARARKFVVQPAMSLGVPNIPCQWTLPLVRKSGFGAPLRDWGENAMPGDLQSLLLTVALVRVSASLGN